MGRPKGPVPEHGTRQRYQLRGANCRCTECKSANARYMLERRWARVRAGIDRPSWEQLALPPELVPRER